MRHLFLAGNPLALLPFYRERVLRACGPSLVVLDDLRVSTGDRASAGDIQTGQDTAESSLHSPSSGLTPEGSTPASEGMTRDMSTLDTVHFSVRVSLVRVGRISLRFCRGAEG